MEIVAGVAVIVIAAAVLALGGWFFRDRLGWFRPREDPSVDQRIRSEVARQLGELQTQSAAPPTGTAQVDTDSLVEAATERTWRLLAEAIDLQRQHKEREAIERLLTAYDMNLPLEAKAQLHLLAGNGFLCLSELEEAEGHYRQSLAAAEQEEDKGGQAAALGGLGLVYRNRGGVEVAEEHHKKSLALNEEIGNKLGQAAALGNLGLVYWARGDLDAAEEWYRRALGLHEEIGNKLGQANQLGNLGLVYGRRGDLDAAEAHHRRALEIDHEIGNKLGQARDRGNLGTVYRERGDLGKAEQHYDEALALFEQVGAQPEVAKTERNIEQLRARKK